eukprot:scaffold17_cov354-Pavlova_lutheri.AAC.45
MDMVFLIGESDHVHESGVRFLCSLHPQKHLHGQEAQVNTKESPQTSAFSSLFSRIPSQGSTNFEKKER